MTAAFYCPNCAGVCAVDAPCLCVNCWLCDVLCQPGSVVTPPTTYQASRRRRP